MLTEVPLRCKCGALRGVVAFAPSKCNRVVCYCDDCQAFIDWLERPELLDAHGGTDIFQIPRAQVRISDGAAQLACMRLSDAGMFRFYARCCKTPIANTVPSMNFAGVHCAIIDVADRDRQLIPIIGGVWGKYAVGGKPPGVHDKASLGLLLRMMWRLRFIFRGAQQPSLFFDEQKQPRVAPRVLTAEERDAVKNKRRDRSRAV